MEKDDPQPSTSNGLPPSRRSQAARDAGRLRPFLDNPHPSTSGNASRSREQDRALPADNQRFVAYRRLYQSFNHGIPTSSSSRRTFDDVILASSVERARSWRNDRAAVVAATAAAAAAAAAAATAQAVDNPLPNPPNADGASLDNQHSANARAGSDDPNDVAATLRYPCRHGCGRELRQQMRVLHELNCESRRYWCPTPVCTERSLRVQYPLDRLQLHFLSEHPSMVRRGCRHPFNVRLNSERNDHWFVLALHQMFHMRVDVNVHLSYVAVYVAYIGPRCNISRYTYRVTVDGLSDDRCLVYSRMVHSVLDSYILNLNHKDCFQLCFEQAQNFLLTWNHRGDRASQDHFNFTVEIMTSDSVQESKNVADFSFIE